MAACTVLVTGVNGMIGHAVACRLAAGGRRVLGMDVVRPAGELPFPVLGADVNDAHALYAALRGHAVERIVHCGGISGPMVANERPHLVFEVNVRGTMTVCEAARVCGVRRVVFMSSLMAYGAQPLDRPVMEDAPLDATDPYGASKVAAEAVLRAYVAGGRFEGASLRLGAVYGPRRTTSCLIRQLVGDALAGRPTELEYGAGWPRQYIYVDDVVEGIVRALDAASLPRHAYNIAGDEWSTVEEIAATVRRVLRGAEARIGPKPYPNDYPKGPLSSEAAAQDLGFVARTSLADGVALYADWLGKEASDGPRA